MTPIGRWARAASCAAAMVRTRPRLSGTTTPGNSTTLRTGTMMIASSGIGLISVPLSTVEGPGVGVRGGCSERAWLGCWSVLILLVRSGQLTQRERQAAIGKLAAADLKPARRQVDATLEASVGDLEAPDDGRAG